MEPLIMGRQSIHIVSDKYHGKSSASFAKQHVCEMHSRTNGKQVCEQLRELRYMLAAANGISYDVKDCSFDYACAGTCRACDEELRYLQQELLKIPEEKRKYPFVEVKQDNTPDANKLDIKTDFFVMGEC